MATMKIVPQKDWDVLQKYLSEPAVVLIPEELLEKLPEDQTEHLRACDGGYTEYNFGGDADTWVDKVTKPDHLFLSYVFPDDKAEG